MNITFTGRHMHVSERLQEYAEKKLLKLETHFDQLIDAHVIMYVEKLDHGAEVIINGDGIQFHGREKASTLYSAIDLLVEKMEKQIVKYKEKHSLHKGPARGEVPFLETISSQGRDLRLNQVSNKPIDKIEAYLQMKVEKMDFILFKKGVSKVDSDLDYANKNYAVIYKNHDSLKMAEIPFDKIKEHKFEHDDFVEYDLNIIDDSVSNPHIEFKKNNGCSINKMPLEEAILKLEENNETFIPFFNTDSQYFNVIYKNGRNYEVAVPAF